MPAYLWATAFTTPAQPTNLVLTPDTDTASILATVDASADARHEAYVWEHEDEDGDWVEIDRTADPELTFRLARHNRLTRIRVMDWNGDPTEAGSSEPLEAETTLEELRWWMVHLAGDDEFTTELRHVELGTVTEDPLDQVVLQPLSGSDGELQPPIVITGQRQAERLTLSLHLSREDGQALIRLFQRAARLAAGSIALKDPKGPVYVVATGGSRVTDLGSGRRRLELTAVRVA